MKARKAQDGDEEYGADHYDGHGDDAVVRVEAVLVVQDVDQAQGKDGDHVRAQKDQEEEEVAVVAPPDAVVHPRAVVVKRLNATVADAAVRAARGTVKLAGGAPLHAHRDAVDLHVLVQGEPEVVLLLLVRLVFRDDAGIHECGQGEIHKHKKRHKALHYGDAVVVATGQLRTRKHEKQRCRRDQQRPRTCRREKPRLGLAFGHLRRQFSRPIAILRVNHKLNACHREASG